MVCAGPPGRSRPGWVTTRLAAPAAATAMPIAIIGTGVRLPVAGPRLRRLARLAVRAGARVLSLVSVLSSTAVDVRTGPAADAGLVAGVGPADGAGLAPGLRARRSIARRFPSGPMSRPEGERAGIGPVPPSRVIAARPGLAAR